MPPLASTFAHCAAVSRIERCSSFASGGVGGRPIGFFGCSMAIVYVMQKVLAMVDLLNHNNITPTEPENTMTSFKIPAHSGILHAGRIVTITRLTLRGVEGVLSCGKPVGYLRVTLADAGVTLPNA